MVIVHLSDNQRRVISAEKDETLEQLRQRFCCQYNYSINEYEFVSLSTNQPLPPNVRATEIKEVHLIPKPVTRKDSSVILCTSNVERHSIMQSIPPPRPAPIKVIRTKKVVKRSAPKPPIDIHNRDSIESISHQIDIDIPIPFIERDKTIEYSTAERISSPEYIEDENIATEFTGGLEIAEEGLVTDECGGSPCDSLSDGGESVENSDVSSSEIYSVVFKGQSKNEAIVQQSITNKDENVSSGSSSDTSDSVSEVSEADKTYSISNDNAPLSINHTESNVNHSDSLNQSKGVIDEPIETDNSHNFDNTIDDTTDGTLETKPHTCDSESDEDERVCISQFEQPIELRVTHTREECVCIKVCSIIDLDNCVLSTEEKCDSKRDSLSHIIRNDTDEDVTASTNTEAGVLDQRKSSLIIVPKMEVLEKDDEFSATNRPEYRRQRAKSLFFSAR